MRVIMTEDTSPTGQVKAEITFKEEATGEIQYAHISGAAPEDNISLALPVTSMDLPIGTYQLDRGDERTALYHLRRAASLWV